jgi:RsiW-degrading membrane proteinase PrsW (M82 family)
MSPTPDGARLPEYGTNEPYAPVAKPSRRWLGRFGGWIVFAIFAVLWAYLLLVQLLVWHFRSEVPLLFGLGAFAVAALFLYQMCYRLVPADGLRPLFLLLVFLFGGLAAYALSRLIEPVFFVVLGGSAEKTPLAYSWLATPTEELCKIAVVIVVARWVALKSARNGLFIGAAVGFGFAAFENIEKAFQTYINAEGGFPTSELRFVPVNALFSHLASTLAFNTALRSVLTPVAHPIWTGLIAAAIFAAYRGNRLRITSIVVIAFVSVALVHALWDFLPQVFDRVLVSTPITAALLSYLVYLVFGIAGAIVWNVVRRRANSAAAPVIESPSLA